MPRKLVIAILVFVLSASVVLGAPMPLATFETDEDWYLLSSYNLQYETEPAYVWEGNRSLRVRMQPMQIEFAELDVHYDMSADGKIVVNLYSELGSWSAH